MSSSESRRKTKHILIRVTPDEHGQIKEKARLCAVTVPQYLRDCGLGKRLKVKAGSDIQLVAELRRLGGLQKHLFAEGRGVGSKEYADVLVAIKGAIQRIGAGSDAG